MLAGRYISKIFLSTLHRWRVFRTLLQTLYVILQLTMLNKCTQQTFLLVGARLLTVILPQSSNKKYTTILESNCSLYIILGFVVPLAIFWTTRIIKWCKSSKFGRVEKHVQCWQKVNKGTRISSSICQWHIYISSMHLPILQNKHLWLLQYLLKFHQFECRFLR